MMTPNYVWVVEIYGGRAGKRWRPINGSNKRTKKRAQQTAGGFFLQDGETVRVVKYQAVSSKRRRR